jgi:hypothetical protein
MKSRLSEPTDTSASILCDEAEGIQFAQPGRHVVPTREI